MFLLKISAGRFLLIALAILLAYELVVYVYFKFVKKDSSSISKNEVRKMRESMPESVPVYHVRKSGPQVDDRTKVASSGWEDLIDYKKSDAASASSRRSSLVEERRDHVVDAFGPSASQMDFSRMDKANNSLMDDLLSGSSSSDMRELPVDNRPNHSCEVPVAEPKDQSDVPASSGLEEELPKRNADEAGLCENDSAGSSAALKYAFSNVDFTNMVE